VPRGRGVAVAVAARRTEGDGVAPWALGGGRQGGWEPGSRPSGGSWGRGKGRPGGEGDQASGESKLGDARVSFFF
jgi:hypothetical protein